MPRSEQVAVQGNGHLDVHHDHPSEPPFFDITPEVFRRFMSYENGSTSRQLSSSSPYHDDSTASLRLSANPLVTAARIDASNLAPGTVRRTIRGIPKRRPSVNGAVNGSSHSSLSARTAAWNQSQPKPVNAVVTRGVTSSSESQTPPTSRSEAVEPFESQLASDSLNSLPLAQYFQQLRVSTREQHRDTHTPTSPKPKQQSAASATVQRTSRSDSPFRFPSLPANLTDDGFHYRQRAAQFILLLSQWASREYMSRWNPLFLPVASNPSKSRNNTRRATAGHSANQHAVENPNSSVLDDNESTHSHDHAHSASDIESEYLDFDACRTAHLGNKKKRKSSRYSNSGLQSMSNNQQTLQGDIGSFPPKAASSAHIQDSATGSVRNKQDRALVDKTNTSHQSSSQLSVHPVYKREDVPSSWSEPSIACRHPYLRLPPRQTSGERHRKIMRNRLRARLVPIFEQRRREKMQKPAQIKQDSQASQEAEDARAKEEVDTQAVTTPEKRAPPKRTLKAGKRAQAIRGGGSSAKPLTIAEIRARAAAASAAPLSGSATPAKTSPSLSSAPSLKEPDRTPHRVAVVEDQAKRHASSAPPAPAAPASAASPSTATAGAVPLHSRLPAPTSKFDFRMSSHITFQLREMRSRLDGATRNLSDPLNQGGPLAVAKILCDFDTTQSSPDNVGNGATSTVTNRSDGYPDYLPPWVRDALEYPIRGNGEQRADAKPPQPRQTITNKAPISPAPANQIRSGTLTPKQQGKQASPPARTKPMPASVSPSTTKAANGRRTASRQPVEPAHKHGAACKHGQPHGRSHPPGTGSALFTDDDWICVFCEYELYYGETPLMLRACRNRKKLVEKKTKVKSKAQAALKKRSGSKVNGSSCQYDHDHYHRDHHSDHDCMHDHDHACHHEHSSISGSECCHHDHDHYHHEHDYHDHHGHKSDKGRHRAHDDRDRCDCGNSIHSSDFEDEDK